MFTRKMLESDWLDYGTWTIYTILLLTNFEVQTGKYLDRSFEVRTERKAKVQIFSRMDRTNWSIRALLYSYNQHLGVILDKMILNWIILTNYTSNSSSIFHSNSSGIFSSSFISFEGKLSFKKPKLALKSLYRPFCLFIDVGLRFSGPIRLFGGPVRLWTDR